MMSHGNASSSTLPTVTNGNLLECLKDEDNRLSLTDTVLPVRINGGPKVRAVGPLIKKLGTSSSAFIGPACRPPQTIQRPPKPKKVKRLPKLNIEDTLNEFYKELQEIEPKLNVDVSEPKDNVDSSMVIPSQCPPPAKYGSNTNHDLNRSNQAPRPHWYNNEPYQLRRPSYAPVSDGLYFPPHENHWQPPPPFYSQPLHRPPHPLQPPPPIPHLPPPPPIPGIPPPPPADHIYHPQPKSSQKVPLSHRFPDPDEHKNSPNFDDHGFPASHRKEDETGFGCWEDWNDQYGCHRQGSSEWQKFYRGPDSSGDRPSEPSMVLILMRGAPGSGKTTRARELLSTSSTGLILSTDDFFSQENGYLYDPSLLGKAHHWNQNRAKEAMYKGCSPVIIDNTNMQAWEMKPYVNLALGKGYTIFFHEPQTSWKFDPIELEKRNKHGVPKEKIGQMLERFQLPMSLDIVMNSQEPIRPMGLSSHQQTHRMTNQSDYH
ncbi:hypothetical protein UPYG_G00206240 [Umbra pygmaea]|uniref:NEDD4-binding protein 2-like 2 n=1 Tax=Umbra pygmaea TaxID=75934 RepID=A0ABD0X9P0_UMBPY